MTPRSDHRNISEIIVEARCGLHEFSAPSEIRLHLYPPASG